MKDAARLLAYGGAILLFAALAAPPLFWLGQNHFSALARFDFETFFHRALLIGAILFAWPLLRALRIRNLRELGLVRRERPWRDLTFGFAAAAIPLLVLGALLIALRVYTVRPTISLGDIGGRSITAIVVPFIEEPLFRGLILGVLLRSNSARVATLLTSAVFSILHFLKAPENTSTVVTWTSGFVSIANAFAQFTEPVLVLAGFTTLFLLGWILADARIRTRALWLPIGLHSGWIFSSALFNKIARREFDALPWIGRSLLIGLAPLCVGLITWALIRIWLRYVEKPSS